MSGRPDKDRPGWFGTGAGWLGVDSRWASGSNQEHGAWDPCFESLSRSRQCAMTRTCSGHSSSPGDRLALLVLGAVPMGCDGWCDIWDRPEYGRATVEVREVWLAGQHAARQAVTVQSGAGWMAVQLLCPPAVHEATEAKVDRSGTAGGRRAEHSRRRKSARTAQVHCR
nr:hypothetical protein CFP56_08090 [Quercus suber]